jgi:hypothetical protein
MIKNKPLNYSHMLYFYLLLEFNLKIFQQINKKVILIILYNLPV